MELNNYEGFQLLKMDETPFYMFKNRGRITKLNKFQSAPTLETELSQEERILNLIESFDRFECSDSDNE